jgi:hypothetical protein
MVVPQNRDLAEGRLLGFAYDFGVTVENIQNGGRSVG